jgi:phosphonate transport system substrate-binding protein
MKILVKAFICLFLVSALFACKSKNGLDSNGVPTKLIIASSGGGMPGLAKKRMEPIRLYLQKELGIPVEFIFTNEYTAVIEALRAKKVHVAIMTPFSYILGSQEHDITPLVAIGENGKPSMYHSIMFTNKMTGLKNMDDVRSRAKTLTLAFPDPASTSGHLIPSAYLNTIGLDPEKAFKETMFAGSHPATILTVKSGKVDIGFTTSEYGLQMLERMKMIKKGELVVLWESDPIVAAPVVIRNDINPEFAKKVKNLYLDMNKKDPKALQNFLSAFMDHPENISFMPVQDSMYNGLRKIAAGIKNLALINQAK